ncbi:Hyalurononglucosaminidase precursor, putative [Pediculus humanus corporis]|uniref:Hyaluronidase n=1 Tax=Pediculus humanus subsp. corporis TaxID=121224 RepID=E0VLE7_PEDHC|nr:Hyalurononglucosaminidase precursor, putative [Pediculus humanus corporis]EEB14203.1 Hyalurononglucosaminidase precursor, putative [Pediculus humanus corporis]
MALCVYHHRITSGSILRDFAYPTLEEFKIYWNVPTFLCHKYGINFKPHTEKYGITSNPKDSFRGKEINILYDPGMFPAVMKNAKGVVAERNGGIPQLGNITLHLEAFKNVVEQIVSPDLHGIGIIDFETWRPVFRQNWRDQVVYKNLSKDLERQYHPQWSEKKIREKAKIHFEEASKEFMEKTLELAKILRPKAIWGYYGFPYCYNYRTTDEPECPELARRENDKILWLFNTSTAFYPSLYMSTKLNEFQQSQFVIGRLNEAWRMAIKVSGPKIPRVNPYIWFKYYDSEEFLSYADIYSALDVTRKYKMGGAIIWGSSNNVNSKEKCKTLLRYLDTVLGPAARKTLQNQNNVEPPEPVLSFINFPFLPRSSLDNDNDTDNGGTIPYDGGAADDDDNDDNNKEKERLIRNLTKNTNFWEKLLSALL